MTVSVRTLNCLKRGLAQLRMPPNPDYGKGRRYAFPLNALPPITVEQLRSMTEEDFACMRNAGVKTVAEIREMLATYTDDEIHAAFPRDIASPSQSAWREHAEMVAGVRGG